MLRAHSYLWEISHGSYMAGTGTFVSNEHILIRLTFLTSTNDIDHTFFFLIRQYFRAFFIGYVSMNHFDLYFPVIK